MHRLARSAALAAFLLLCVPVAAGATTPERIREATERGEISRAAGLLYRAYALHAPERVPARLRAREPYDGTLALVQLRADVARLPANSPTRREIDRVAAADAVGETCEGRTGASTDATSSPFLIQHDPIAGGLTLADYRSALLKAHEQVSVLGWVPPPNRPVNPAGRYHVVIADLGTELYGYTSTIGTYAGTVGARSVTSGDKTWTVADGEASCMVLNSNFAQLTTPPATAPRALAALQATAAHEFNHALQFSLGVIESDDLNNSLLVEAGATLMEDEVQDAADDNLHYLTRTGGPGGRPEPSFTDSLIPRPESETEFYAAWFLLRGLTERFGTAAGTTLSPGGGEDVPQLMWELTSGRPPGGSYLGALDAALIQRSGNTLNLGMAYHDAAIADWFLHECVPSSSWAAPYCFQEAAAYRDPRYFTAAGLPATYTIPAVPGATPGDASVERNYAIEFVRLPNTGGPYDVTVANTATPGASFSALRASVVCDKGAGLYRAEGSPATLTTTAPDDVKTFAVDTTGCATDSVAVVISSANHATQSPQCDSQVRYSVTVARAANAPTALPTQFCNPVVGPDPTPSPSASPTATPTVTPEPTATPTTEPPPPTTIELPPTPTDLTPPDVNVSLARRTVRGLLTFTVTCPVQEETRCDVSLRGTAARSRRKVAVKRLLALAMAPGERRKVRVRLRAADIRRLGRGLITVTLVTNANDGAGNRITGARFVLKTRI